MPNRPDWNASDWKEYFQENHPNFWFKEQLKKETLARNEKEKLIEFLERLSVNAEQSEVEKQNIKTKSSLFFKDPLKPKPEEWIDWTPEKWLQWADSDEYKRLYASSKNIYRPSGVQQPDPESVPILEYKDKMPVFFSKWSTPKTKIKSTTMTPEAQKRTANNEIISVGVNKQPEQTFLFNPTQSPTEDPSYIYARNDLPDFSKSQVKEIDSNIFVNEKRRVPSSVSSDYLYNNKFQSSNGLPSSEFSALQSLEFARFKDRETGAINPSMLLLTKKPNYSTQPIAELSPDYLSSQNFKFQPSFQEGSSPSNFQNLNVQNQGSLPTQGGIQDPQSRPPPANSREQQNKFRPVKFRPRRPGQEQDFLKSQSLKANPNAPDNSNLSPEVFLPPIDKNNPNFQEIFNNPNPNINPYFPPNYPYNFPNQFPAPQPASSSTSTSSGGGGSSAAASSSAGHSSSSSTSVSKGGNNNNDNVYYECNGSQCDDNERPANKFQINDENRNVFISDETTTTTIIPSITSQNLLENITFPSSGNSQINLNIPPGVSPPPDLQDAINKGGTINLNCDLDNGCPTLVPIEERSSTTTNAPVFSISISPIFGNINRGSSEESSSSDTSTTSLGNSVRDKLLQNSQELQNELPQRGLGDDYINEIYELDAPRSSVNKINSNIDNRDRVGSIDNNIVSNRNPTRYTERVADIPNSNENSKNTEEDLKDIVKALTGLIQLLNTTSTRQGRPKFNGALTQPFKHLGNKRYPVKNIIFDDDAMFSNLKTDNIPDGDILYFNTKKNLPFSHIQKSSPDSTVSTIPPHLIPLGPDGTPLVKPDGTYILPGVVTQNNKLSNMFPYLSSERKQATKMVTQRNTIIRNTTDFVKQTNQSSTSIDNRDMFTKTIDMINDMPMDTKRHMLANMMVGVPMAAITMAAVGLPPLGNSYFSIISNKGFTNVLSIQFSFNFVDRKIRYFSNCASCNSHTWFYICCIYRCESSSKPTQG